MNITIILSLDWAGHFFDVRHTGTSGVQVGRPRSLRMGSSSAVLLMATVHRPWRIHSLVRLVQTSWVFALRTSLYNQSLAAFQSLFTVAGDTPNTWEVSSMDRPAKKRNSTIRLCCWSNFASPFRA